jgi:hypothetical protein
MPGVPFEGRLLGAYSQDSLRIIFCGITIFIGIHKIFLLFLEISQVHLSESLVNTHRGLTHTYIT